MDALERMPSFLGLPILERSASLFFPRSSLSFFLYIFAAAGKRKYQMGNSRQMSYLHVLGHMGRALLWKISAAFWCWKVVLVQQYKSLQLILWQALKWDVLPKEEGQWGDNSTLVTTFVICESCSKIDNGQRWLNKKARLCACATYNKVIHKRKRWLISIVWSGNQDLVAAKPNRIL